MRKTREAIRKDQTVVIVRYSVGQDRGLEHSRSEKSCREQADDSKQPDNAED